MKQPVDPRRERRRLTPAGIALLYAVFAALWIAVSSALLNLSVDDPILQGRIEIAKGLLFVAVTSGMLYVILREWRKTVSDGAANSRRTATRRRGGVVQRILFLVVLALLVPLSGFVVLKIHEPQVERDAFANLKAIADLKAGQIESWLYERQNDGAVIMGSASFTSQVGALQNEPDKERANAIRESVRAHLISAVDAVQYDSAVLIDVLGNPLLEISASYDIAPQTTGLLQQAFVMHQAQHGEVLSGSDGLLHLDFVVPLISYENNGNRKAVGGLVLSVLPEQFMFPFVEHWPTVSASGEALLVRRDGDTVLFINEPTHFKGGGLVLRRPLSRLDDPVVAAVNEARSGVGSGVDYRGVEVLAAYRPVTGTEWVVVAKLDRSEVMMPLRQLSFWVSLIALVSLVVIGAVIFLLWRQREHTVQLELQAQSDQVFRQFYDLPFIGIAISSPTTKGWLRCNDRLCEILGYSREELLTRNWAEMTHPDDLAADVAQFERLLGGEIEAYSLEKRFLRKDGSVVFVSLDVRGVRAADGTLEHLLGAIQDVTERKLAEAGARRLTAIHAAVSECNQAIIRSSSADDLFPQLCRIAVLYGGMKTAWVGLLDKETLLVRPTFSFGDDLGMLSELRVSIDPELPRGRGPTGIAVRERKPYWVQNFLTEPTLEPWYERAERSGWQASAALPLTRDGEVVGALILYAGEINAFDDAVQILLIKMAQDVSFALTLFAREEERRAMELALRESESRFRDLYEKAPLPYQSLDAEGNIVEVNDAWLNLLGYRLDEVVGRFLGDFLSEASVKALDRELLKFRPNGRVDGPLLHFVHKDGTHRLLMVNAQIARDKEGNFLRVHCIMSDLTERLQSAEQIRLAAAVFEQSAEGIVISDAERNVIMVNQAYSTITGYGAAELIGKALPVVSAGHQDEQFMRAVWHEVEANGYWHGEIWNRRKDGDVYPELVSVSRVLDADGNIGHYITIVTDISKHKANEAHIHRLAHFDALTGLPNRSLLADRVSQSLSRVERNAEPLALVFLDLDRFKNVNDSLGHRIGDDLLVQVAERLRHVLRDDDTVSRLGGDEFILVLPNTGAGGAAHVAEKVLKVLSASYLIENHELNVTASLGIAMFPSDGDNYDALSMCADAAMYRAKQGGRNTFRFFTREMQERSDRTLQLENALRRALELDQLELHYQPQISLVDGRVIGVEALVRWTHPELGRVSPADFIPVAEESGLILPIGEWVLRMAIRQMRLWQKAGLPPMVMAVNLSAVQFRQARLPELVSQILDEFELSPACLELELTEGVAMDNPLGAIAVMNDLHERGVRMSIDDFGTGYSSLSYLKRFKVYKLKIDQSFVRDISTDPEDAAIVEGIIGLSRSLGLQTIAEGVESAEQLAFLRERGCAEAQGYHIGRPMTADEFETFLRDYRPSHSE
ncbi:MAG: EAL domain-containing protein [Propionivibrio sp.]